MNKKKALFIRIHNGGAQAEAILDKEYGASPEKLLIGSGPGCDLVAPVPEKHRLFKKTLQGLYLRFPDGAEGEITLKGSTLPVKALIDFGLLKKDRDSYLFRLPNDPALSFSLNGALFELGAKEITAEDRKKKKARDKIDGSIRSPFFRREDRLYYTILAITAFINIVFVIFINTLEVKKKDPREAIKDMPKRFARLILQPPKVAPKKVAIQKAEEKKEEEKKEEKQEKKKPEEQKKREEPLTPQRELARAAVANKGLLGVITAKTKPLGLDDTMFGEIEAISPDAWKGNPDMFGSGGVATNVNTMDRADQLSRDIVASGPKTRERSASEIMSERKEALKESEREKREGQGALRRDEAGVYRTVTSYNGGLRFLYNNALKKNPMLRGKITVRLTISAEGKVRKVEMTSSTLNFPELEEAIINRIYLWKFPEAKGSEDFTIPYTFDFAPVG